jgi:hypothetical protein
VRERESREREREGDRGREAREDDLRGPHGSGERGSGERERERVTEGERRGRTTWTSISRRKISTNVSPYCHDVRCGGMGKKGRVRVRKGKEGRTATITSQAPGGEAAKGLVRLG